MNRDMQIAWAAGFLEGEGCFGWYGGRYRKDGSKREKGGHYGYPLVAATQANLEPLAKLHMIFPQLALRETKPSVTGKPTWECRCTGEPALEVMRAVLPYMSERKAVAIRDAIAKREVRQQQMAYCPKGHTGEFGRRSSGSRYCRACAREYQRERKAGLR